MWIESKPYNEGATGVLCCITRIQNKQAMREKEGLHARVQR